jgi:hypothetical protein
MLIRALKKMHLALAAYIWGRLIGVFFLVYWKLCFYYSLSVEITQKTPNSPFLGFPRALYRNSAQIRKNSPIRRRASKYPWGGIKKKRQAGHFRETFLGRRGGGRRGNKHTREDDNISRSPARRHRRPTSPGRPRPPYAPGAR